MLVGQDWPYFYEAVDEDWEKGGLPVAGCGEDPGDGFQEEESKTSKEEKGYPDNDWGKIIGEDFHGEQATELAFQCVLKENITKREGVIEKPELLATYPHFEVRGHSLYKIDKGKVAGREIEQIMVLQWYQRAMIEIAHALPLVGHLGRDKTIAWLMM